MSALSLRDYKTAEVAALQAQTLQPDHSGVHNLLGQIWLAESRPDEAIKAFSTAVDLNPKLPNLRFNLGLAYQAKGQMPLAIEQVTLAIQLDPSVPILHTKLGQLLMMSGSPVDAIPVLRHSLDLDPKQRPPRVHLAQALIAVGELEEATDVIRKLLIESPRDPSILRLSGTLHQVRGEFHTAAGLFQEAIALKPMEAANYLSLSQCRRMTSADSALVDQMMRLCVQPEVPAQDKAQIAYAIAKAMDDQREFADAFRWYQKANELELSRLSSSGRSFDPLAARALTSARISRFDGSGSPSPHASPSTLRQPLFIVGMIRSGTTLVEQILSRHPEVSAGGEITYWAGREAELMGQLEKGVATHVEIEEWRRQYDLVPARARAQTASVTDKMPLNYRALGLILMAYPDAKIIHCRRNPVDTCLSVYFTPYRSAPDFAHDLSNIAEGYRDYQRLMDHWRTVIPADQLIEVDYEALVSSPESEIQGLVSRCGLPWSEDCLDASKASTAVRTPSLWQVRQPIHQGSIGRWKNYEPWIGPLLELEQS